MSGTKPQKPVDPSPHIEAVDDFLRRNKNQFQILAEREKATTNKPAASVPTDSLSTSPKEQGKATQGLKAIETLEKEKNQISEQLEANKANKEKMQQGSQGPRGPGQSGSGG